MKTDLIARINQIPFDFLTTDQVAEIFNVSRSTIYNLQKKGIKVDNDNRIYLQGGQKIMKKSLVDFINEAPLKAKIIV